MHTPMKKLWQEREEIIERNVLTSSTLAKEIEVAAER
jgi:hypothetical protein